MQNLTALMQILRFSHHLVARSPALLRGGLVFGPATGARFVNCTA